MNTNNQFINLIVEKYHEIKNSDISQNVKNKKYSELMTDLENHFKIPILMKDAHEVDQEILDLYQEISYARDFSIYD